MTMRSFCQKLRLKNKTPVAAKSWKYSLPTEAKWEYACEREPRQICLGR